jgi:hypothetical protein
MDAYHQIYYMGNLSPLSSNCQNSSAINENKSSGVEFEEHAQ